MKKAFIFTLIFFYTIFLFGISWEVKEENGKSVLYISVDKEETDIENYNYNEELPWNTYRNKITNIVINDGVTSIGDFAFTDFDNLESVSIPGSVSHIGDFSFAGCNELLEIKLPENIEYIGKGAFAFCDDLVFYGLKNEFINWNEYDYFYNSCIITPIPTSEDYVSGQREIFDWYTSLGVVQTETCDDPPAVVHVDIALGYKKDDEETASEITDRTVELKAFLRRFFSTKTAEELRNPNNEDHLENEIKEGINDKILSSSRIRDVVFQRKDVTFEN